jgi:hypothetical protein
MNDDFLHRIRVEPRPQFIGNLRVRLHRQSEVQGNRRIGMSRSIRYLLPLALGCAIAIALVVVNGDRDSTAVPHSSPIPEAPVDPISQRASTGVPVDSTHREKKAVNPPAPTAFRIAGTALLLPSIRCGGLRHGRQSAVRR